MFNRTKSAYASILPDYLIYRPPIRINNNITYRSIRDKSARKASAFYKDENALLSMIDNEKKLLERRLELLKRGKTESVYLSNKDINKVQNIRKRVATAATTKNNSYIRLKNLTKFKAIDSACITEHKKIEIINEDEKLLTERKINKNEIEKENILRNSRRKSSVFKDIYEIKRIPNGGPTSTSLNQGFSKTHLFDVYLDDNDETVPIPRKNRPSIVNLYDRAFKLNMIEKHNPSTVKDFSDLIKHTSYLKSSTKPKYDFKSQSLVFDHIRVRQMRSNTRGNTNQKIISSKFPSSPIKSVIHFTPQ